MAPRPPTPRFGNIELVGMPRHPLGDLYFKLIEHSWLYMISLLVAGYVVINVVFAALYLAGGDCIEGARPGSFADAFAFSVQSISTIGYGALAPKTTYADVLVTMQSMFNLFGLAVGTGLMFSKFARPRAMVLFSETAVVTRYNQQPALMFRVANGRGNDVVEASMRVSILLSDKSPEGHVMRRMHDLQLLRSRSPVFLMSWLAIHIIDENSPLFGHDAESLIDDNAMIIITLTGIDGTLAQTVYARHTYHADELRWGHRFVDAVEISEDRVRFHYERFHDVEVDVPVPAEAGSVADQPPGDDGSRANR